MFLVEKLFLYKIRCLTTILQINKYYKNNANYLPNCQLTHEKDKILIEKN